MTRDTHADAASSRGDGATPASSGRTMLFFRSIGAIAIAAVACLVPEVGENRFVLAGLLVFVCVPTGIWLERTYPVAETGWSEPLFDLGMVVSLVHLVPDMWFVALVIGLMVVQAPSVGASHVSFLFYSLFAVILTSGMTLAALVHDVQGWELPILAMTVLYPSVIYYAYVQAKASNATRAQAETLEGLTLMAGGVAHDFNNLLTSVMGHAELALSDLPEGSRARESLREVVRGSHRASLLAARLLAFSGRSVATDEPLDLEAEIRELVGLLQPAIPKGITLGLVSGLDGACVRGDRAKLQQVAMNLILNACEATETLPNSVIVTLGLDESKRRARLGVTDHGTGISGEARARIFDPFFSSKREGRGLGLATVRETVREMGGQLQIESREGHGTHVEVLLPALPREEAAGAASGEARDRKGGFAMVVDDEPEVRETIAELLRSLHYQVVAAADGPEAIDRFRRVGHQLDVVVMDLRMPGMDGWECLQELRAMRRDLPVLICSGFDPTESEAQLAAERVEYLPKPFRRAALSDALDRLANGSRVERVAAS